jgi:hypothetical protein
MSEYYAIALDKEGTTIPVVNLSNVYIIAENEAKRFCKQNNLTYQYLREIPGTGRQNGTLTKTIESKRGRKMDW